MCWVWCGDHFTLCFQELSASAIAGTSVLALESCKVGLSNQEHALTEQKSLLHARPQLWKPYLSILSTLLYSLLAHIMLLLKLWMHKLQYENGPT